MIVSRRPFGRLPTAIGLCTRVCFVSTDSKSSTFWISTTRPHPSSRRSNRGDEPIFWFLYFTRMLQSLPVLPTICHARVTVSGSINNSERLTVWRIYTLSVDPVFVFTRLLERFLRSVFLLESVCYFYFSIFIKRVHFFVQNDRVRNMSNDVIASDTLTVRLNIISKRNVFSCILKISIELYSIGPLYSYFFVIKMWSVLVRTLRRN